MKNCPPSSYDSISEPQGVRLFFVPIFGHSSSSKVLRDCQHIHLTTSLWFRDWSRLSSGPDFLASPNVSGGTVRSRDSNMKVTEALFLTHWNHVHRHYTERQKYLVKLETFLRSSGIRGYMRTLDLCFFLSDKQQVLKCCLSVRTVMDSLGRGSLHEQEKVVFARLI